MSLALRIAGFVTVELVSLILIFWYFRKTVRNQSLHVQQRQSLVTIFIFLVVTISYFVLVGPLQLPWEPSLAVVGNYGFVGLIGFIGRKERIEGRVIIDERDREIDVAASMFGFGAMWGVLCLLWIWVFLTHGPDGNLSVRVGHLGWVLMGGAVIIHTVRAAVILYLYRRDSLAETN